ncbi:hypothetical protein A4G20_07880 [Pasteurellaceae bacterium RH1A]|nr:hypothetical protein A4G20_07880 [Pasteurellaceae bacterium RH1A]
MYFYKHKIALAVLASLASVAYAEEAVVLDEISVKGQISSDPLAEGGKVNDVLVSKEKLQHRASTLGNALNGEAGVHSNQFGGGASAPIIRGQEGVRVKILQNGSDVVDMSQLSPDHAISVDTLLAEKVEIIRGSSTLLYANASPAGVINVIDKRIPEYMPQKPIEADMGLRYNTNSHEKLANIGLTLGLGKHLALRAEGLNRLADNYKVKSFHLNENLNFVPDTHNRTQSGTLGLSLIGDRGFIGASYSERKERYGLPGHNHNHDSCSVHIIETAGSGRYYLGLYPHLMDDKDLNNTHFHCGYESSAEDHSHSHDNPYGHKHDHTKGGPQIHLRSKRYDVRSEIIEPIKGLDKIRFSFANSDYYHDERDADIPINLFKNKGNNYRLEFFHQPLGKLSGMFGLQYQTQTSSANIPRIALTSNQFKPGQPPQRDPSKITEGDRKEWALIENKAKQVSFFALEQFKWQDFTLDLGFRTEKQTIKIDYDREALAHAKQALTGCAPIYAVLGLICPKRPSQDPDLTPYKQRATSYSASLTWQFKPDYRLVLIGSHNERLPSPMELYYHGKHLATNSFEYGNKNLKKERSNNFELALGYEGDSLDYRLSAYYSRFANRIFNQTLNRQGNLTINRYSQSQAKYYGLEGKITYALTSKWQVGAVGDYVRGRLFDLPPTYVRDYASNERTPQAEEARNAPRVPPLRLGFNTRYDFTDHLSLSLDYTRMFSQKHTTYTKVRKSRTEEVYNEELDDFDEIEILEVQHIQEHPTKGHHLLNLGLSYQKPMSWGSYQVFIDANNLLNEKVYSHTSFLPYVPQMGRNLVLGVNLSFK